MISPVETWTRLRTGLPVLDAKSLEHWQLAQLRNVLAYARECSRFYGEGLRDVDLHALACRVDLARLPFTWPSEIAQDPLAFLCVPQRDVARVTTLRTSGTGGLPKRIFFTQDDLLRTVDFFEHGMRTLVSPGQRALILMPGASEHSIGRLLQTALLRMDVQAILGTQDWTATDALEAARGVDCLVGIPAQIIYLCRTNPRLRPRTVLLSADYAPQSVIRAIEQTWGCQVLTHYGMTETGFGCAVQCSAQEGHHLRDAELILEIVDPVTGIPVEPGMSGEIVITTLRHEAMPLLRYRTGDTARIITNPCLCGSLLPRLGRVEGRLDNDLSLGDGSPLNIHALDELVFEFPAVRAFEAELRSGQGRRDAPVRPGLPVGGGSRPHGAGGLSSQDRSTLLLTLNSEEPVDQELKMAESLPSVNIEIQYADVCPFPVMSKRKIHTQPTQ